MVTRVDGGRRAAVVPAVAGHMGLGGRAGRVLGLPAAGLGPALFPRRRGPAAFLPPGVPLLGPGRGDSERLRRRDWGDDAVGTLRRRAGDAMRPSRRLRSRMHLEPGYGPGSSEGKRRGCDFREHRRAADLRDGRDPGAAAEARQCLGERLLERRWQRERAQGCAQRAQLRLQALAAPEEDRLDGRARQPERRGDLAIRQSVELAQHDCVALLLRELGERHAERLDLRAVTGLALGVVAGIRLDKRQRFGPPAANPPPALVARDRPEPSGRIAWLLAREQCAVGGEECLLRRVLSLGRVAQDQAADAEDHPPVLLEELGNALSGRPLTPAAGERKRQAGVHLVVVPVVVFLLQPDEGEGAVDLSAPYLDLVVDLEAGEERLLGDRAGDRRAGAITVVVVVFSSARDRDARGCQLRDRPSGLDPAVLAVVLIVGPNRDERERPGGCVDRDVELDLVARLERGQLEGARRGDEDLAAALGGEPELVAAETEEDPFQLEAVRVTEILERGRGQPVAADPDLHPGAIAGPVAATVRQGEIARRGAHREHAPAGGDQVVREPVPDDGPTERRAAGTTCDPKPAGLEGAVREPPRREDEALAGTHSSDVAGRTDGADDAAARSDHQRMPRRILRNDGASERGRRSRKREHGRSGGGEEEKSLHLKSPFGIGERTVTRRSRSARKTCNLS